MPSIQPKIRVDYVKDASIITFTEEKILEDGDILRLQESVMSVIDQAESMNLVLDFVNVQFLSSAVLGFLIRLSKRVYEKQGKLALCNINAKIYEIFKITRLTKIFDIYKNAEEAIESFSRQEQ